jgi:hypothetical protein
MCGALTPWEEDDTQTLWSHKISIMRLQNSTISATWHGHIMQSPLTKRMKLTETLWILPGMWHYTVRWRGSDGWKEMLHHQYRRCKQQVPLNIGIYLPNNFMFRRHRNLPRHDWSWLLQTAKYTVSPHHIPAEGCSLLSRTNFKTQF